MAVEIGMKLGNIRKNGCPKPVLLEPPARNEKKVRSGQCETHINRRVIKNLPKSGWLVLDSCDV
jgi:hypothetical protein